MKRREAIKNWILGGAAIALSPGILSRCTKDEFERSSEPLQVLKVDLNAPEYKLLKNPGSSMVFPSENIIVANSESSGFIAASCKCPHGGRTLQYNGGSMNSGVWRCPGHCSGFDYVGKCLCGPAKQPISVYPVRREGDLLNIYL